MNDTWLVVASICGCGHTTITLMDRRCCGPDAHLGAESDEEIIRTGNDWRGLAAQAASELAERTGTPISGQCAVVYLPGGQQNDQWLPVSNELTGLLYDLTDKGGAA